MIAHSAMLPGAAKMLAEEHKCRTTKTHCGILLICGSCVTCAPFVQHGPWVRAGASGAFITGGAVTFDNRSEVIDEVTVAVDGSIRAGLVPNDSSKPAFSLGVQLPLFPFLLVAANAESPGEALTLVSLDGYITGPRFRSMATSAGVIASTYHIMPYIQMGSRSPAKSGWYMTNGFLFVQPSFVDTEERAFMWLPSVTIYDPDSKRPRATHLTIGGGIGSEQGIAKYLFSIGIGFEAFRSGARVR